MRENRELDTQIYEKIQKDMGAIRKEAVMPKEFPTTADKIKYPD